VALYQNGSEIKSCAQKRRKRIKIKSCTKIDIRTRTVDRKVAILSKIDDFCEIHDF